MYCIVDTFILQFRINTFGSFPILLNRWHEDKWCLLVLSIFSIIGGRLIFITLKIVPNCFLRNYRWQKKGKPSILKLPNLAIFHCDGICKFSIIECCHYWCFSIWWWQKKGKGHPWKVDPLERTPNGTSTYWEAALTHGMLTHGMLTHWNVDP